MTAKIMLYVATLQTSSQTESACNASSECKNSTHNVTSMQHETQAQRQNSFESVDLNKWSFVMSHDIVSILATKSFQPTTSF